MPAAFNFAYLAGELSPIDFRVGGKMGQRQHTAKRHSKIEDQDLAERMFELRKLRELVRNAETSRPNNVFFSSGEDGSNLGDCLRRHGSNSKIVD
jgi:hypothetical protein